MPPRKSKSAPRPDARLAKGRDARSRLINAAVRVFAKYGYEGASLRVVAQEAGMGFQLIAYHFGSKQDLWVATLNHLFDQRLASVKAFRFDLAGDLSGQFKERLRAGIKYGVFEPELRKIFTQEYFESSKRYTRVLKKQIERFVTASRQMLVDAHALGIATRFSPEEMQLVFRSVVAANSVMPYEMQLTLGCPVADPRSIELQTELLYSLFVYGSGTAARA